MKRTLAVSAAILALLARSLSAQTADDLIEQGRAYLAATNMAAANICFSNAVVVSPNHQTGNVFYASTRLLVLPSQPIGSNFLNRIGLPAAGRNIYNWTAEIPADTNDVPFAPPGVNAGEFTAMVRTNILASLLAAETNLSRVANSNFTLSLTSNETRTVAVTLDYGDVQLLRAMLKGAQYFAYTVCSWNFDAELAAVRALYTNDEFSVQRLLLDYPNLLTFATTNDLIAARGAFQSAVNRYMEASQFIRSRPTNVTRLFNNDTRRVDDEERFRLTLVNLTNSLLAAVPLSVDTNYTVFLSAHFNGLHPPRSFLPVFRENGFGLGTAPDLTFGGMIFGLSPQEVDAAFANLFFPISTISPVFGHAGGQLQFPLNVAKEHGYVLQVSTDLLNWVDHSVFFAFEDQYQFSDPVNLGRRFYRLVDRTGNMPPPANDAFANRAAVPGMNVGVTGYTSSTTHEGPETNWLSGVGHTIWWTWTSPISAEVAVLAFGGDDCWPIHVFTGSTLATLTSVAEGWNDARFNAQAGVTYQIAVDTCWKDGGLRLLITRPPVLTVNSPADGAVFTAPANIPLSCVSSDPDGTIRQIAVDAWPGLHLRTNNTSLSYLWTNVPSDFYNLSFMAKDNVGCPTWVGRSIRVRPPNDDFASSIARSGAPLSVNAVNRGALKEPGEPDHAGGFGGRSVWWSWTATSTGPVTILCTVTNGSERGYPLLGVYLGNTVSNLTVVASNAPAYGTTALVGFNASSGQTYRVAADSQDAGFVNVRFVPTRPPTVTITAPLDGDVFFGPTNIQISAQAADPDGSISNVTFYGDGGVIGSDVAAPYSTTWSNVAIAPFSREIVAYAVDNSGVGVFSDPIYISVIRPPPPNDNFASAASISGAPRTVTGFNEGATSEPGEPDHAGNSAGQSVWWSWTSASNGPVSILCDITNSGWSAWPLLGVYVGSTVSNLTVIASNAPVYGSTALVSFNASVGQTYKVAVDSFDVGEVTLRFVPTRPPTVTITAPLDGEEFQGPTNLVVSAQAFDPDGSVTNVVFAANGVLMASDGTSPFSVTWSNITTSDWYQELLAYAVDNSGVGAFSEPVYVIVHPPPPANDTFANRIQISGTNVTVAGTNSGATLEAGEPFHWGGTGGRSVWWKWQAPRSGTVFLQASGNFSTILAVYTGTAVASLNLVANDGSGWPSQLSFTATSGVVYQIAVDGDFGQSGEFTLTLEEL